MELFEQIRREYEFGAGTILGIARKLGVHRRMVREAVRSATPARRKKTERPRVKMAAVTEFIEGFWKPTGRHHGSSGIRRNGSESERGKRYLDRR